MTTRKIKITYSGTAPGADSNTYNLFNSTLIGGPNICLANLLNAQRLTVSIQNSQSGTLKGYRSNNGGTTWVQVFPDTAVTAASSGSVNFYDLFIAEYRDFKLDWVNGGSAQATWNIDMSLEPHQVKVT